MRKFILLLIFISFSAYSQTNRFTGTWSNENCKNCKKDYIFKLTIAQSNSKIFGTAEVISDKKELNSGILEISGHVYTMGEKAQIKLVAQNGMSVSAVLLAEDGQLQFTKRGGDDLVPGELILSKLYE